MKVRAATSTLLKEQGVNLALRSQGDQLNGTRWGDMYDPDTWNTKQLRSTFFDSDYKCSIVYYKPRFTCIRDGNWLSYPDVVYLSLRWLPLASFFINELKFVPTLSRQPKQVGYNYFLQSVFSIFVHQERTPNDDLGYRYSSGLFPKERLIQRNNDSLPASNADEWSYLLDTLVQCC